MNAPRDAEPPDLAGRLDSWKEIAAYLGRTERTVRRWEQSEGLPVHRLMHDKKGSVYAYAAELDTWRASRRASEEESKAADLPSARDKEPGEGERAGSQVNLWVTAAAVFLCAALAVWITARSRVRRPLLSSIAVLPFDNLSHDQAQEWFSDGMTETLITELSKIRVLKVISRTSVMQYKGGRKSLKQIASELGVEAVVEGSALRVGDRVRITAQLIDTASDTHLWGRDFDRDIRDVLAVQREVAANIAQQVGTTLHPEKPRSVNTEAIAAYLKSLYLFNRFQLPQAIDLASQAIRLDPQMAQAHELRGMALLLAADDGDFPYATIVPEVRASLARALELEPDRGRALSSLGYSYFALEHDWDRAERDMRRGFELDPTTGNSYAYLLAGRGQYDAAIRAVDEAVLHDPANPFLLADAGRVYHLARQYDAAVRLYQKAIELNATSRFAWFNMVYTKLAAGKDQEAFELFLKAPSSEEDRFSREQVQTTYQSGGWPAIFRLFVNAYPRNQHDKFKAFALLRLGRRSEALAEFEILEKQGTTAAMLDLENPNYDPLRQEPRFKAIMKRVGYPESMWQ